VWRAAGGRNGCDSMPQQRCQDWIRISSLVSDCRAGNQDWIPGLKKHEETLFPYPYMRAAKALRD